MRISLFLLLVILGIALLALPAEAFMSDNNGFLGGGNKFIDAGRPGLSRTLPKRGYFNPNPELHNNNKVNSAAPKPTVLPSSVSKDQPGVLKSSPVSVSLPKAGTGTLKSTSELVQTTSATGRVSLNKNNNDRPTETRQANTSLAAIRLEIDSSRLELPLQIQGEKNESKNNIGNNIGYLSGEADSGGADKNDEILLQGNPEAYNLQDGSEVLTIESPNEPAPEELSPDALPREGILYRQLISVVEVDDNERIIKDSGSEKGEKIETAPVSRKEADADEENNGKVLARLAAQQQQKLPAITDQQVVNGETVQDYSGTAVVTDQEYIELSSSDPETYPASNFNVTAFAKQIDTNVKDSQLSTIQEHRRNNSSGKTIGIDRRKLIRSFDGAVMKFNPPSIIIDNLPHGCDGCAFVHGVVKEKEEDKIDKEASE